MEKSSFAGGCFWGVEHAFKQLKGVISTQVGYQGGDPKDANYRDVCSGKTGHAEAVLVEFNPKVITYERLLDAFFMMHDPSQLNRQGPDIGEQYRSALFPRDDQQKKLATSYITKRQNEGHAITTTIEQGHDFIAAEAEHQNYLDSTPGGYCHIGFDVFSKLKRGEF